MQNILSFWYVWPIGLAVFAAIVVFIQLKNVHFAIDNNGKNPNEVAKRFLSPWRLMLTVLFGLGAFICLILFFFSIIYQLILVIKG